MRGAGRVYLDCLYSSDILRKTRPYNASYQPEKLPFYLIAKIPVGAGFTNNLCEKPKISKTRPHPTNNPNTYVLKPRTNQVNLDYRRCGGGLI
jgi:hypothetical protein